jgi:Bacterial protein of unknown function (Gcw_chp)
MQRANVLGTALLVAGASVCAVPARAQAELGVDLGIFSSYVWRGLSLTNKPVAQPAVYVTIPAGNASVLLGGWASIDLGKYDDPLNDFSESGGTSSFNFAEFDPYAEVSFPVGKATLTGGATAYIYPNDFGFTSAANTVELYAKAEVEAPLTPKVSIYYDVDKIKGAYFEAGVSHSLAISEKTSLDLGALAGFSAGQGIKAGESANFSGNGFTHLDVSAGIPFTAGALSITPLVHLIVAGDDFTKLTSPSNESDVKVWGGVSLSWAKALGPAPEATDQPKP